MTGNTFTSKTDLGEYLNDKFNRKYYKYFRNEGDGIFKPLEFFNLFYKTLEYCILNNKNSSIVIGYINNIKLTDEQRLILIGALNMRFSLLYTSKKTRENYKELRKALRNEFDRKSEIADIAYEEYLKNRTFFEKSLDKIENFFTKKEEDVTWNDVEEILKKTNDINIKNKLLIRFKLKSEHKKWDRLYKECEIELKNNKELQALHSEPTKKIPNQKKVKKEIPKDLQLKDVLKNDLYWDFLRNILVNKKLIDKNSGIVISQNIGIMNCCALLKDLYNKGYYKENKRLNCEQILLILQNTFGVETTVGVCRKTKAINFDFEYIPYANTINEKQT